MAEFLGLKKKKKRPKKNGFKSPGGFEAELELLKAKLPSSCTNFWVTWIFLALPKDWFTVDCED